MKATFVKADMISPSFSKIRRARSCHRDTCDPHRVGYCSLSV
jgi:hypothetical protein